MILEVVFINVYKHHGSWIQDLRFWEKLLGSKVWIQDPRSKILGKTSWIQGLDPRSKIQDSGKNFLDPRSGSKIQDPRFQEKLLGSTVEPSLQFINAWKLAKTPPTGKGIQGRPKVLENPD